MTAIHTPDPIASTAPVLYVSLEPGSNSWKLASTIGRGQKPRVKTLAARDRDAIPGDLGQDIPGESWTEADLPKALPRLVRIHMED